MIVQVKLGVQALLQRLSGQALFYPAGLSPVISSESLNMFAREYMLGSPR